MTRCIVADDEKIILDELCTLLGQAGAEVEGAYSDPFEALEAAGEINPDAAFLDIEMPGMNGIELAKKIVEASPRTQIVFVTAYENYALKAFDVRAVHYILKPITQENINEAVERVNRVCRMNEPKSEIAGSPDFIKDRDGLPDRISLKDRDNVHIIKTVDIIYVKSEGGKTVLVTKKGSYPTRSGLIFWESQLKDSNFIRCHRSYIVNTSYITRMLHILGEYKELVLDYCDVNIPISRQKVDAVKDWLGIN